MSVLSSYEIHTNIQLDNLSTKLNSHYPGSLLAVEEGLIYRSYFYRGIRWSLGDMNIERCNMHRNKEEPLFLYLFIPLGIYDANTIELPFLHDFPFLSIHSQEDGMFYYQCLLENLPFLSITPLHTTGEGIKHNLLSCKSTELSIHSLLSSSEEKEEEKMETIEIPEEKDFEFM